MVLHMASICYKFEGKNCVLFTLCSVSFKEKRNKILKIRYYNYEIKLV